MSDDLLPYGSSTDGGGLSRAAPGWSDSSCLVLFFACLLARPFASQRGLHTLLLARLQVKGVSLDLLNNVFLLYLALEPSQCILEGFSLLQPYFGQNLHTPKPVRMDRIVIAGICP